MMKLETVYVTVGTTQFVPLIKEITSDKVLSILKSRGCRQLTLQFGNIANVVDTEEIRSKYGICVEQYAFKFEPVRTDILKADLIIGHAGAGTCMDILNHGKPGLIVVNDELMDNHQMELALQLADEGYIYYCDVQGLAQNLATLDFRALKPYEQTDNINKLVSHLKGMISS